MSSGHIYEEKLSLGDVPDRTSLEATGDGSLGIVTTKLYPPAAVDPAAPVPASGDRYYNTAAREWRWFDGVLWQAYGGSSSGAASPLSFGAGRIGSSTTTRYLFPDFSNTLAQTVEVPHPMPRDGTLLNLYVVHSDPRGNGNNVTYTVRVNGVATALSVTLASTASSASDLANSVAVLAGDLVDIEITKGASVGQSPFDVVAVMELA